MRRVVIIGGGIAGTTAAEGLAAQKDAFEVTLIEREMHPLYSRVLLPHYLRGQVPRERVFLKKEVWYQEKGIEWIRGIEVLEVDEKNQHVALSDGRELPYDILIIAGGGDVRLHPNDMSGMCYLRGIDDADHILASVAKARAEQRGSKAVVLGSSFIAVEFLNYFHGVAGYDTHICTRGTGFWSGIVGEEMQAFFQAHALLKGITLHAKNQVSDIEGGEHVERVKIDKEILEDIGIVGVGLGILPDMAYLAQTGIERKDDGVTTNEYLETNIPNVYAIGDIAHFFDVHAGRQVTIGNWQNAIMQARHVIRVIAGERAAFDLITSYATNLLGLEVTFIGDTSRAHADSTRLQKTEEGLIELFDRGGVTVGAVIAGAPKERMAITQAIKTKSTYGA